jgi:hypothetical protein
MSNIEGMSGGQRFSVLVFTWRLEMRPARGSLTCPIFTVRVVLAYNRRERREKKRRRKRRRREITSRKRIARR